MAIRFNFSWSSWYFSFSVMKNKWISIAIVSGLGLLGGVIGGIVSIYNRISYDVLSYNIQAMDSKTMTIRVVFGVSNNSKFDLDLWNQKYDVFVSGYKVSQITSLHRYKIYSNNTSVIPLDVTLLWSELQGSITPIGTQVQLNTIASLPLFIKGNLSAKLGAFQLRKIPVRWRSIIGEFLP